MFLFLFSGCGEDNITPLRQDINQLKKELTALGISIHKTKTDMDTVLSQVDKRSQDQLSMMQKNLADINLKIENMGTDLSKIDGKLDEYKHKIDESIKRMDQLLRQAPQLPKEPGPPQTEKPPVSTTVKASAGEIYQMSYIDYTKGNYSLAITGFQEFLRLFSDSDLADNAQYWIGECYFSQKQFEKAAQEFRRVSTKYPQGDKVPSALLKESYSLLEIGQKVMAEARLQYLIDAYPRSEEAALARDRLKTLQTR